MSEGPNIVQSALQAGRALADKIINNPLPHGRPVLITRDAKGNAQAIFLSHEHMFEAPARTVRTVHLYDLQSFIGYFQMFSNSGSGIYASAEPGNEKLVAIINDHTASMPAFADHRAVYEIKKSPELKLWEQFNGHKFESSEAFAEFIEGNLTDFTHPSGARMLEIATNLQVNANAAYGKAIRLSDGNIQLTYTNEVNIRGGEAQLPSEFQIFIPVFAGFGAAPHDFGARLRVRLSGSKLVIWYELIRPQKVIDAALMVMCEQTEDQTARKIIMGAV